MPKYMYSGNYTKEGAAGLLKDGGKARKEEAKRALSSFLNDNVILITERANS